jgi:hypothetical protein
MEKEAKKRKSIPLKIEKQITKQYSNLCAICGKADPQVHHIDENPSNNEPLNIIPLCTDCHLIKIHKKNIYPREIIRLFRVYKSKLILSDKFLPIFNRMKFLLAEDISSYDSKVLQSEYNDLISFIKAMEMGILYAGKIKKLLYFPLEYHVEIVAYPPDPEYDALVGRSSSSTYSSKSNNKGSSIKAFTDMYRENKEKVIGLIIEQLIYQKWVL